VARQVVDVEIVRQKGKKFCVSSGGKTVGVCEVNFRFAHLLPADNFSNNNLANKTQTSNSPADSCGNFPPDESN